MAESTPEKPKRPRGRPPTRQREREIEAALQDENLMRRRVPLHNIEAARAKLRETLAPQLAEMEKLPVEEAAERHKRKKYAVADLVLADALKDLEEGKEDVMSPLGIPVTRSLSQKAKLDNAKRVQIALQLQDVALGMPSKLTARMDDLSVSIRTEIREVVEVRPSPEEIQNYEDETMAAIMPPDEDLPDEVIEGEVE